MSHFHPLEVVGRGSETQLQEGVNLNMIKGVLFEQISVKLSKWTSQTADSLMCIRIWCF